MSLYDDIIVSASEKGDIGSKSGEWSGIKLLETHLLSKKKNQPKKEFGRRVGGPGFGFKNKTTGDELPPPPVIDYQGKQSNGSLLGGDWDVAEEYDPLFPNDYEKVIKERREKMEKLKAEEKALEKEELERRRREQMENPSAAIVVNPIGGTGGTMFARSLVDAYSDDEEDTVKPYSGGSLGVMSGTGRSSGITRTGGAAIAPPPSLITEATVVKSGEVDVPSSSQSSVSKSSVAAKIMARMGYKEGQGLGKEEQGISRALEVEKTSKRGGKIVSGATPPLPPPSAPTPTPSPLTPPISTPSTANPTTESPSVEPITEIMKNPTKIVLLRNMVGPGEVDDDLEPEVKEECSKYGEVVSCVIFERPGGAPEDAVRIFVEFKRVESAIKAVVDLNGRYFGGRVVKISFYDPEKFKKFQLVD